MIKNGVGKYFAAAITQKSGDHGTLYISTRGGTTSFVAKVNKQVAGEELFTLNRVFVGHVFCDLTNDLAGGFQP